MHRIIALLLLSGLAAMLASGQTPPMNSLNSAPIELVEHISDRNITSMTNNTSYTRISFDTRYLQSDTDSDPIDYTLKPSDNGRFTHAITTGSYTFRSSPTNPAAGCLFEHGNAYVTIIPLFPTTGIAITTTPKRNGIKEDILLSKNDPLELSWRIEAATIPVFREGSLVFADPLGNILFSIPAPTAQDHAGISVPIDVTYEQNILTYRLIVFPSLVWPVLLDPSVEVAAGRDGRVQRTGQATYVDARDHDNGTMNGTSLFVGQNGASGMSVFRSFVSFPIPELTTATACTLYVNGTLNASVNDFDIYLFGASAYRSVLDGSDFSRFDGRETAASHTGTILNNTWSSSSFSSGWNAIVFNSAGLDSIEAAYGDTLWIVLLSSEDYINSAPSSEEYVAFESSAHTTDKPYLALEYETDDPDPNHFSASKDGRIRTNDHALYATARDTLVANADGNWVQAGQQKTISDQYNVYRGFLSFPLPEIYTVQSCTLFIKGYANFASTDDFSVYLVGASAYGSSLDDDDFPRFDGREAGTSHTGTILNDTWNSLSFTLDWNAIILNQAGLDSLRAASGDTLRIAMLSNNDYANIAPDGDEYLVFRSSLTTGEEPYLSIEYTPGLVPPSNFSMTAINDSTIACAWDDIPGETGYAVVSWPDKMVIHTLSADAVADTITGLDPNTVYTWAILADSLGIQGLSTPDSTATLLATPERIDIRIMPVSSDTLRISIPNPPNAAMGESGMEVAALSGESANNSGWLTGNYQYCDGGLDCDSTYVYRIRLRNREGIASEWSEDITFTMNGRDSLIVQLPGDLYDDYNVDGGSGKIDSTVVRAGQSDTGDRFNGFLMFTLPWQVQKGGVDSLFINLVRTSEESDRTPTLILSTVPDKLIGPAEYIDLDIQDVSTGELPWTVEAGTGECRSPDLRQLFREWQEMNPIRDYPTRFGIRLGGGSNPDSVRAVFLDASHLSYSNDTFLTIYYSPGAPDSLDAAPANPDLQVETPDSITVGWEDRSRFELGFLLLNATDSTIVAGTDTLAENSSSTGVGGLIPNTVYQWFIRAFSAVDDSATTSVNARTLARTPGSTTVSSLNDASLQFVINPADNPEGTAFSVQDSLSGFFVDGTGVQDTLRPGPPGEWAWRTWIDWGAASGDTLTGLLPDSLFVLRANARTSE